MKCKVHPYANKVGVCAPCLRERLLTLAALQNEASSPAPPLPRADSNPSSDYFPRSVSPYVSRHRRSDAASSGRRHHHPPSLLFFRTPQVGPSAPLEEGSITFERKKKGKFSLMSALFGSHHPRSAKNSEISEMDSSNRQKSGSWISSLVKKNRRSKVVTEIGPIPKNNWWDPDQERGLSPDRNCESLETGSCVSDSPWRPTPSPMRRGMGHRKKHGAPGFAVCLSPLVRPSPAHRRSQVSEAGFSGDLKSPAHHRHMAGGGAPVGPSLCHNRSRKIADIGRHHR